MWASRHWSRHLLLPLLAPLACVFYLLTAARKTLYRMGAFKVQRVNAKVIVVGNAVLGGAGKTPTVIALVQHLQAQQLQVGVVSRGYGRNTAKDADSMEVLPEADPLHVGDEPLLIRKRCAVPVFVGRSRASAAQTLLAQYPRTEIVVCDDGLQHYALYRDLDICVFDDRGIGNGWVFPMGPLRETWPHRPVQASGQRPQRLLSLHTGQPNAWTGFHAQRSLSLYALTQTGQRVALNTLNTLQTAPHALPLFAVAAIARPEVFFAMLRAQGLTLAGSLALPDHDAFTQAAQQLPPQVQLLCTEKDAYKLWPHRPDALAVPLEQTMPAAFWAALHAALHNARHDAGLTKLSSPHGHTTT